MASSEITRGRFLQALGVGGAAAAIGGINTACPKRYDYSVERDIVYSNGEEVEQYATETSLLQILPEAIDILAPSILGRDIQSKTRGENRILLNEVYPFFKDEFNRHNQHTMHFYRPVSDKPTALVIWYHGGSWMIGNADVHKRQAEKLAQELGIAVATPNYSLAPERTMPAQIIDARDAFNYLVDNAGYYNIDKERIGVAGNSAGGHISGMLSSDPQTKSELHAEIHTSVLIYPVMNLEALSQGGGFRFLGGYTFNVKDWEDEEKVSEILRRYSPLKLQEPGVKMPRVLAVHGDRDAMAPPTESIDYVERLHKLGYPNAEYLLVKGGHAFMELHDSFVGDWLPLIEQEIAFNQAWPVIKQAFKEMRDS